MAKNLSRGTPDFFKKKEEMSPVTKLPCTVITAIDASHSLSPCSDISAQRPVTIATKRSCTSTTEFNSAKTQKHDIR